MIFDLIKQGAEPSTVIGLYISGFVSGFIIRGLFK